ncbi:MAG: hypothetical protein Q7J31_19555 [Syntrophales bacterium]|nr:hypothetical protein [Syntrophales bacterium]
MRSFFSREIIILGISLLLFIENTPVAGAQLPFELRGFLEARGGLRTQDDPHESKTATLEETRVQLHLFKALDWARCSIKSDFIYDGTEEGAQSDFREVNALFSPFEFMELKAGRQILTWGTGDYIFINDLFPKDYKSFFTGRDDEYLKAPSDALKTSIYTDVVNLDFVYTPRFNPDRFIDGRRLSYFNPQLGRLAGKDAVISPLKHDEWFEDSEIAWRLSRDIKGYGLALYGYHGFWKSPMGFDPQAGTATFPRLSAYGLSVRGTVWEGIGNFEMGYYDSREDRSGESPFIPNSQLRYMAGYEQELAKDFTAGVQYYLEQTLQYGAYRRTLPLGMQAADEFRQVITIRLTKLLLYQNLKLSLFTFYSPSDQDVYIRPNVHYKITDHWSAEGGANIFAGRKDHTFFGQFKNDTNIYAGVRWSF